ncbi:MAG: lamin tail domain-containing protein, partial [Candidatus Marinimicrobia bacterium]|nr:lamin tail domain-containing protein [Candidatus Neomarinimicrobiota bacterium]
MISEVMIDPQGTDSPNEFVELTNISNEPVDLTGWRLGDLNSTDELSSDSLILWPGEYAVIFEGDYIPDSGAYAGLLPPGTHILFVDDNSIGNGLANSADSLFLLDSAGTIIDRMGWSETPAEGFTLEKVLLGECDTPGNWRSSLQPLGTPGNINSVSGQIIDLSLDSLSWQLVSAPNYFDLTATVSNLGLRPAAAQLVGPGGQLAVVPELAVGATFAVIFDWSGPDSRYGFYATNIWVTAAGDYDQSNDSLDIEVYLSAPAAAVLISEVMYTPLTLDPEWVEVFNPSGSVINLKQWLLWDQATSAPLPEFNLIPGGYLVLASDSSTASGWPDGIALVTPAGFPILNNSGDQVILTDPYSVVIDQLDYTPLPQTTAGISLERVVLDGGDLEGNWQPSLRPLGTPGGPNSVAGRVIDFSLDSLSWQLVSAPHQYTLTATVTNRGLRAAEAQLAGPKGPLAVVPELEVGATFPVTFDWSGPDSLLGFYSTTIWVTAVGDYDQSNDSLDVEVYLTAPAGTVLITEIMYTPLTLDPEWVEVFNPSGSVINFKQWGLWDQSTGATLPEFNLIPGGYLVLASDSSAV